MEVADIILHYQKKVKSLEKLLANYDMNSSWKDEKSEKRLIRLRVYKDVIHDLKKFISNR